MKKLVSGIAFSFGCAVAFGSNYVKAAGLAILNTPASGECADPYECLNLRNTNGAGLTVISTSTSRDATAAAFVHNQGLGPGLAVNSLQGRAVQARSGSGVAVFGESRSGAGPAVQGVASTTTENGIGVLGEANWSGTAVVGYNHGGGTAGFFDGWLYYTQGFSQYSDARLKKDIRDISYGVEELLKLRPVAYQWKNRNDAQIHLGFLAQDVEAIIPEIVTPAQSPAGEQVLTLSTTELIPLLVKAIQQQNQSIIKQRAQLEAQEARLSTLEKARTTLASGKASLLDLMGGGAAVGLLPLGLVLGALRQKTKASRR